MESAALGIWTVSESHLHVFRNLCRLPSVVANYVLQLSVLGAFLARRGGLWPTFWSLFETSDWGAYPTNFIFEAVSLAKSSLNGHIWCWRVLWASFCIDFGTFFSAGGDDC